MLDKIKYLIREFILTFSNKPSLFASKRIERCIAFILVSILVCFFIYHKRNDMIIITPLLAYAGFNTMQISKDKKDKNENIIKHDIIDSIS